jgi:hypothetical protein
MMLVDFLALSVANQLELLAKCGRPLPLPRWEADYYVVSYYVPTSILVEVRYHLHSGLLYQVQAHHLAMC